MARSVGIDTRASQLDAETVLVGTVLANGYKRPEDEVRDGSAMLLTTALNAQDAFKFVGTGHAASVDSTVTISAANVPEGGTLGDASTYAQIAVLTLSGVGSGEVLVGGLQVKQAIEGANPGLIGTEIRGVAVKAVGGPTDGSATVYASPLK